MRLQFSYSSLKRFVLCPRQYYEVKVKQNFIDLPNEKATYGKSVHSAFENYVKSGIELPENYKKIGSILEVLLEIPGKKYTEVEIAVDQNINPCDFNDPEYFVRGIVDLLIVDGNTAFILDYKTGSVRYADPKQLKLLSLLTFIKLPSIEKIRSGLIFLSNGQFMPSPDYHRSDIPSLWDAFAVDLTRLAYSFKTNEWPENPNGLCRRHCPVVTCDHCGGN